MCIYIPVYSTLISYYIYRIRIPVYITYSDIMHNNKTLLAYSSAPPIYIIAICVVYTHVLYTLIHVLILALLRHPHLNLRSTSHLQNKRTLPMQRNTKQVTKVIFERCVSTLRRQVCTKRIPCTSMCRWKTHTHTHNRMTNRSKNKHK